jgi:hypothetical protein
MYAPAESEPRANAAHRREEIIMKTFLKILVPALVDVVLTIVAKEVVKTIKTKIA